MRGGRVSLSIPDWSVVLCLGIVCANQPQYPNTPLLVLKIFACLCVLPADCCCARPPSSPPASATPFPPSALPCTHMAANEKKKLYVTILKSCCSRTEPRWAPGCKQKLLAFNPGCSSLFSSSYNHR